MPTYESTEQGYGNMWDRAVVGRVSQAVGAVKIALAHKSDYLKIQGDTGIPWFTVAGKHMRESDFNFKAHLHNGDALTARTVHVPKGRPVTGSPPFDFFVSAEDALDMAPHCLNKVKRWSVERILYEDEKYNGWGYISKGNSPYLWAGTSLYSSGKYIADHVYSPSAKDPQLGTVAFYKQLAKSDPSVAKALSDREATPPKDVVDDQVSKQTEKEKRIGGGAAGGTVASGGAKSWGELHPVVMGIVLPAAIGIFLAILIACVVSYIRKRKTVPQLVHDKWGSLVNEADGIVKHKTRVTHMKKRKARR